MYQRPHSIAANRRGPLRILFLDLDGVVCCNFHGELERDKLAQVARICREAEAVVVLSTDWRRRPELRRRAEQTLDIAQRQATGDALHQVTFLTFKLALHRVAARHVAGLRLQLADARVARGDERGALHEYKRALTEERAGWARTGRLEWAPAASLLNAARLTRLRAKDQADLDDAERLLRAAYGSEAAAEDPAQENATEGTRRAARHDLCVLLCQSDYRADDAAEALTSMGYRYRLSEDVLRYDLNYGVTNVPRSLKRRTAAMETHGKYVRVFDGAMPAPALHHLRSVVSSLSFTLLFPYLYGQLF